MEPAAPFFYTKKMHITNITRRRMTHYLTAFFIKWSGKQWFDTTQLAIVMLKHYNVTDHEPNQLELYKGRLRKELKEMVKSGIVEKRQYENELKNTRYQYKYNEDVWKWQDAKPDA